MAAPSSPIRTRLAVLVLAAVLPLLVFSALLLQRAYHASAGLVENTVLATAQRLAVTVDSQVGRAEAVGVALAELSSRDIDRLDTFGDLATRALTAAGLEGSLLLVDRDGNVVAQSARPGTATAALIDPEAASRTLESGEPQISELTLGQSNGERFVVIHVPVVHDGIVRFDAAIVLPARALQASLSPGALRAGWFAVVADRAGRIVFDSGSPAGINAGGDRLSAEIIALTAHADEGIGHFTTTNGTQLLIGYARSERADWIVAVGAPVAAMTGPTQHAIDLLALGGAVVLIATLGLAWRLGHAIILPLNALAAQAARLARNEVPDADAGRGLAESEAAAEALAHAGRTLLARHAEREHALRRAEASEQRLLLAQEAGEIGAWDIEIQTGLARWSPRQFLHYGLDPAKDAPRREAWLQLIHPDDHATILAATSAGQSPAPLGHVFRIVRPDGAVRWLRSVSRSTQEPGEPSRISGITVDITERQNAELMLRESAARLEAEVAARTGELARSEERFRTYFTHSSDALLIIRVDGDRFVYESINPAAERLIATPKQDVVGRLPDEIYPPEIAAKIIADYREVLARKTLVNLEQTMTTAAGILQLETTLVPVLETGSQRVDRIISKNRDVTQRRLIQDRLAHAQRLEAVGQLTGGVAHDFNNLLTVIIGNLSLLRSRIDADPRAERYLTSVEAAAERGARLTASLLAFARRQTLQLEPIDVGQRIGESVTLLRRALGEPIALVLDVAADLPLAHADAAQFEAAILNLVINARDAIQEAAPTGTVSTGSVRIGVRAAALLASDLVGNEEAQPGPFIAVTVRDDGPGMEPVVRARAFEPFFTTKDVGRGTGLGLSQVFGFVRQIGGHVALDSAPNHGTTVTLYLPLARPAAEAPSADAGPQEAAVPSGAVVLVVEDDAGIRETTAEVLRDAGLLVREAPNGDIALAILCTDEPIDLVFSDVVMPGGTSGYDLARAARSLRGDIAILLTTGYADRAGAAEGAPEGMDILPKPYTRTALLTHVTTALKTTGTA